jgi:arginyl-tRNA--protein-N-Asp/Glu arginylyltransferase
MHNYLTWETKTITDFSPKNIDAMYDRGFVFTRPKNGLMQQTRSVRIDLSKFALSSENKRILRKTENLRLKIEDLPYNNYSWEIGKMGRDFYDEKFGQGTFSANKIKELLTGDRSDFNRLFVYSLADKIIGYCIAAEIDTILHYSFPFYIPNSTFNTPNIGMGMMLRAIEYAREQNRKFIYLGSAQRPTDTYKLQFKGLEWFDGEGWSDDLNVLKNVLIDTRI